MKTRYKLQVEGFKFCRLVAAEVTRLHLCAEAGTSEIEWSLVTSAATGFLP